MATEAWVSLWGRKIGAVALADGDDVASFEYTPAFADSGIEVSPLVMPLSGRVYSFPGLPQKTFYGLPGLLADILRVGTSAGGARAKALVAWNRKTNEVRSGQVDAGEGFEYWLLKFDGVKGNRDKELDDPKGYGAIEYACYLMARDCGIEMNECRLFEEGDRRHFMTRRFDRSDDGKKLHMQSLCALAHFDFNLAGAYSYEQAYLTIRQLGLPMSAVEQ